MINTARQFFKKNFITLDPSIELKLVQKLRIDNVRKLQTMSILTIILMGVLLLIDYQRLQDGKFEESRVYTHLFLTHISLVTLLIPTAVLFFNREKVRRSAFPYAKHMIIVWIILVGIILIAMALFSFQERNSILTYAIYIIMINFVLILDHFKRSALNLISFFSFLIAVSAMSNGDGAMVFIGMFEAFCVTLIAFSVSTHIYNLVLKEAMNEEALIQKNIDIEEARNEVNKLLLNILPAQVAEELIKEDKVTPRNYQSATVMMIDFIGFSRISKDLSSEELVGTLDYCFTHFDRIILKNGIEKIKTIGDGYLCVGGIPIENDQHVTQAIDAAFEILQFLEEWKGRQIENKEPYFEARIGIHTGPLTAGVVGESKFAYDIWGSTVNVAARIEAAGAAGRVNISKNTYELCKKDFAAEQRGSIPIKNLGAIEMYFVQAKKA